MKRRNPIVPYEGEWRRSVRADLPDVDPVDAAVAAATESLRSWGADRVWVTLTDDGCLIVADTHHCGVLSGRSCGQDRTTSPLEAAAILLRGAGDRVATWCSCAPCASGTPTAGHCVDIDGDLWHDCPATLEAIA